MLAFNIKTSCFGLLIKRLKSPLTLFWIRKGSSLSIMKCLLRLETIITSYLNVVPCVVVPLTQSATEIVCGTTGAWGGEVEEKSNRFNFLVPLYEMLAVDARS